MTTHFGLAHPLAGIAMRMCDEHYARLGSDEIACGRCWETAIRNDERIITQYDLPPEYEVDINDVDEIAVERATRGERVSLTAAELRAAASVLSRRRMHPIEIGRRLHITYRHAVAVLASCEPDDRQSRVA